MGSYRRRGSSAAWLEHFSTIHPILQNGDDEIPRAASHQTGVDEILQCSNDVLTPPCFNWYPLEIFLKSADPVLGDGIAKRSCLPKLCLLEYRSLTESELHSVENASGQVLEDTSSRSGSGHVSQFVFRQALNEQELYLKLQENVRCPSRQ
jgi:hypothetical protein